MKIGIIGGGLTGLVAGFRLARHGHQVSIFEAGDTLGGLLETISIGGERLEKFYHHIFTHDTAVIALVEELNLSYKLKWHPVTSALFCRENIYPLSSALDILKFNQLSFFDRLSLGLLVAKASKIRHEILAQTSAKDWVIRNAGSRVYELVFKPMLRSKFDLDASTITAAWLVNKIKLRGSTRKSMFGKEVLGYLDGSFGQISDKLALEIKKMGGKIFLKSPVSKISPSSGGGLRVSANRQFGPFDKVIVTTSPEIFLSFGVNLPHGYLNQLKKIQYKANICLLLQLSSQVMPYYWLSIAEENSPYVALIEHTNMIDKNRYGHHLLYLTKYVSHRDPLFLSTDASIKNIFVNFLEKIVPHFQKSNINEIYVSRARYAQPVIKIDYLEIRPKFETPLENLYLASMAQIYPEDRGQNYAIRMGNQIAELVGQRYDDRAYRNKISAGISVFLPAYNEEANIKKAVSAIRKVLESLFDDFEIIVINDGSTDRTGQIIDQLARTDKKLKVVHHPRNLGYGGALESGFKKSRKDLIFFTDADRQYDFLEIKKFLGYLSDFDAIIGYRTTRESTMRHFNAFGWKTLIKVLFRHNFRDIDCAFKLFKRRAINNLKIQSKGAFASAELLIKIADRGFKIKQLPVSHCPRKEGRPTGGRPKVILKAFQELYRFYKSYSKS